MPRYTTRSTTHVWKFIFVDRDTFEDKEQARNIESMVKNLESYSAVLCNTCTSEDGITHIIVDSNVTLSDYRPKLRNLKTKVVNDQWLRFSAESLQHGGNWLPENSFELSDNSNKENQSDSSSSKNRKQKKQSQVFRIPKKRKRKLSYSQSKKQKIDKSQKSKNETIDNSKNDTKNNTNTNNTLSISDQFQTTTDVVSKDNINNNSGMNNNKIKMPHFSDIRHQASDSANDKKQFNSSSESETKEMFISFSKKDLSDQISNFNDRNQFTGKEFYEHYVDDVTSSQESTRVVKDFLYGQETDSSNINSISSNAKDNHSFSFSQESSSNSVTTPYVSTALDPNLALYVERLLSSPSFISIVPALSYYRKRIKTNTKFYKHSSFRSRENCGEDCIVFIPTFL
eukprot:gb/GECH01007315.1/.p1 GENE.gb/GECH01007315.1/~~gb/GECH01007315.1/.p1  ORF type:complete len:399 (+),score=89.67 gb/GECH01007315.1/:1-1197(+)